MLIRVAQLRPRRIRRHGKTSMGTLLVLIALGVTLAVPASASATGVHVSPVSAIEPRFPYLPPTARPATRTTTSPWLTGGTAALIVMGTFALALWTESRHADHSGLDEGMTGHVATRTFRHGRKPPEARTCTGLCSRLSSAPTWRRTSGAATLSPRSESLRFRRRQRRQRGSRRSSLGGARPSRRASRPPR